jgi:hypothetical protein
MIKQLRCNAIILRQNKHEFTEIQVLFGNWRIVFLIQLPSEKEDISVTEDASTIFRLKNLYIIILKTENIMQLITNAQKYRLKLQRGLLV